MSSGNRDFEADVRIHIDDYLLPKFKKKMPFRLVDTYTGLILEQSDIIALLKTRRDYNEKLRDVISEAERLGTPIDPDNPSKRPKLEHFEAFIAEYLAFAMFSHRWRGREPTLQDVRKATLGIYSMKDEDLVDKSVKVLRPPTGKSEDKPTSSGVEKLQEFCCLAAKCGFRWAWSDTCCINKEDYAETSESINCMFLWYHSSDLTIVYLDDVGEVKVGRLPAVVEEDGKQWFEDREIRTPLPPSDPNLPSDIYVAALEHDPHLSLHARLRDRSSPRLRTMQPDAQVETPHLEAHLIDKFPTVQDCKLKGRYRKLPIWVTRGWTLQEMIASKRLRFYSEDWTLLEEADDRDTDKAEAKITITSFKYRARLVDHRASDIWGTALVNTTGVPLDDLRNFRVGTADVRSRLRWAARRTTTKVEDMAYCLLGIFDISLPAMYGEGSRAFFRLQDELMKRTGDTSLFDWCGRRSSVNSFLAHSAECFIEPNLPPRILEDSSESIFRMIVNFFYTQLGRIGSVLSVVMAAVVEIKDWILSIMRSTPPGHTLVNGELNVSFFEHQVKSCEFLGGPSPNNPYHHFRLEADCLKPTVVTLASHVSSLVASPKQYYLCRAWDRRTKNVFHILLEFIEYILKDKWKKIWGGGSDSNSDSGDARHDPKDEADHPESKLRQEMQMKRKEVLAFFEDGFPTFLVRVEDGRRVRVNTVERAKSDYFRFDFTMPVVARMVL